MANLAIAVGIGLAFLLVGGPVAAAGAVAVFSVPTAALLRV